MNFSKNELAKRNHLHVLRKIDSYVPLCLLLSLQLCPGADGTNRTMLREVLRWHRDIDSRG